MEGAEISAETSAASRCEVCSEASAKYRCPKCLIRTCSLPCVKKHKENKACDGVRDKTKFTKVSEFNDLDLLSDYRFLEEAQRKADNAVRDQVNYVRRFKNLPTHLKQMTQGAKKNGTHLCLLPKTFTKRMKNKTRYFHATKQILWMVEWVFPQAEAKHLERHLQGDTLADALSKIYDPEKTDPIVRATLKRYVSRGLDDVRFFLRKERCPANDIRYYELKPSSTFVDVLKGKVVIEYPTIHVVYKEKGDEYPLVEQEDESEEESESGSESESENEEGGKTEMGLTEDTSSCKRNLGNHEDSEIEKKRVKLDAENNEVEKTDIGMNVQSSVDGKSDMVMQKKSSVEETSDLSEKEKSSVEETKKFSEKEKSIGASQMDSGIHSDSNKNMDVNDSVNPDLIKKSCSDNQNELENTCETEEVQKGETEKSLATDEAVSVKKDNLSEENSENQDEPASVNRSNDTTGKSVDAGETDKNNVMDTRE